MAQTLEVKVSKDAIKHLTSLRRSSGLTKDKAVAWLINETAIPYVRRASKGFNTAFGTEELSVRLDQSVRDVIEELSSKYKCSKSAVVEAYLVRD
jgi:hypothetical protein